MTPRDQAESSPPWVIVMPTLDQSMPAEWHFAVKVMVDALGGEDVGVPVEAEELWHQAEHLCSQIPGVEVAILLPTSGRIHREPRAGGDARKGEEPA
jgi:hypothetical protein